MPTIRGEQIRDGAVTKAKLAASAFNLTLTTIDHTMSPYTPVGTDELILVDCSTAPVVINLPALAGIPDGRRLIIKDASVTATTNNITVNPDGFELIDGASSVVLVDNGAVLSLVKTSVQWIRFDSTGVVNFILGEVGILLQDMPEGYFFDLDPTILVETDPETQPSDTDDLPGTFT